MAHAAAEQVLVTGGAGFIGSHLVDALLMRGCRVRVVDNLVTGQVSNLKRAWPQIEFIEGDVSDFATALSAAEGCAVIFHQAALASVPRSVSDPLGSHAAGPTATLNMLEAARRAAARRLIFAASSSAYGNTDELPKHENMLPLPLSPYAASKLAGEHYVRVYAQTMGLDGISLRYFNIYGPRQDPSSPYSGVISLFAQALLNRRQPTIFGDGTQTRDFTFVADAVRANLLAFDAPLPLEGQVVNVGAGRQTSLLQVLEAMNRVLETDIRPILQPARAGDVAHSLASLGRVARLLGYAPTVGLEEGLRKTLEWMARQPQD
jgi:UDP-glucose 4-epimerase